MQDLRGLGELNLAVVDDLELIAPGIADVEARRRGHRNARLDERITNRLLVVYDQAEVAVKVRRLRPPPGKGDELIAHVHEGHRVAHPAAQLEVEDLPVPLECLVDVADLERHVVDPDEPGHVATLAATTSAGVKRYSRYAYRLTRTPAGSPSRA